ncbi:hypothetical protein DLAC_09146 [Tieghemostelium lacteum]|uniref:Uncharacterized protein n=1 Tax=Tieghemostelium lacteum TaxID=361077 RepID=A0A151Z993_TIELA|nr:hypothetical protein DLAC_09146 [Tieghemostelium lacteum]|eukprot:KYQ90521.1 hypothetical protein DLAC_09146 [Tieghemostelium lacteum]
MSTTSTTPINNSTCIKQALDLCNEANQIIAELWADEDKRLKKETIDDTHNHEEGDDSDSSDEDTETTEEQMKLVEELFNKAIILNPESVEAYLGLAYVMGMTHEYDKSEHYISLAEKCSQPNDERVKLMKEELTNMKLDKLSELKLEEERSKQPKDENKKDNDEFEGILDTGSDLHIPYLIHNGSVTKKFIGCINEIFQRFSKNDSMGSQELQAYSKVVNGVEMDKSTLSLFFKTYHTEKRRITFRGFIELYVNQTLEDASETWKDLKTLGYSPELVLLNK